MILERYRVPRRFMAVIARFRLVTILAGGRVLFGGVDPGYVVFRPLLITWRWASRTSPPA